MPGVPFTFTSTCSYDASRRYWACHAGEGKYSLNRLAAAWVALPRAQIGSDCCSYSFHRARAALYAFSWAGLYWSFEASEVGEGLLVGEVLTVGDGLGSLFGSPPPQAAAPSMRTTAPRAAQVFF